MDSKAIAVLLLGVIFALAGVFDYLLSSSSLENLQVTMPDLNQLPSGFVTRVTAFLTGGGSALKTVSIDAELSFDSVPFIEISFEAPAQITMELMDERTNIVKLGPTKKSMIDLRLKEGEVDLENFYGSVSLSETVELEGKASHIALQPDISLINEPGSLYIMGYGLKAREVRITNSSLKDIYLPPANGWITINDGAIKCNLKSKSLTLPSFKGDVIFQGTSILLKGTARIRSIDAICGG